MTRRNEKTKSRVLGVLPHIVFENNCYIHLRAHAECLKSEVML